MFKTFGEYMYTLLFSPLRRGRQSLNQFYIFFKVMGRSFDQCKEALLREKGREPTLTEIAQQLELPLEEVTESMDAMASPVSLYEPVYSDGGDPLTVMDQVRDTKNTDEQWIEHIALRQAMEKLADRERRILALRFYDGKTQMEVAQEVGISQAQVSRLEKNALQSIRRAISS